MNTSHIVVIVSSLMLLCVSRISAQSTSLIAKAKKGDVSAQKELGFEYQLQKNYIQAEYWYQKAANQGSCNAQWQLGLFYIIDLHNIEKGKYWLQKAANQGDGIAQCYLGYYYKTGKNGFPKDDEKSFFWYQMGANNKSGGVYQYECQKNLGDCYRWGKGVAQNNEKAFYWYQLASYDFRNRTSLGDCYYYGIGVPIDYYKAYKLYREGNTSDGYTPYRIGICYYYGHGIEKDYQQAVKWFQRAKGQKNGRAAQYLGYCYMYGRGVPKDLEKADEMFKYASNKGYDVSEDFKRLSEERRKHSVANNTNITWDYIERIPSCYDEANDKRINNESKLYISRQGYIKFQNKDFCIFQHLTGLDLVEPDPIDFDFSPYSYKIFFISNEEADDSNYGNICICDDGMMYIIKNGEVLISAFCDIFSQIKSDIKNKRFSRNIKVSIE